MSMMDQSAPAAPPEQPTVGDAMKGQAGQNAGGAPEGDSSGPPIQPNDPAPWMPSKAMAAFAQLVNMTLYFRMKPQGFPPDKLAMMAQSWQQLRMSGKPGASKLAAGQSGAGGAGGGGAPAGPSAAPPPAPAQPMQPRM